MRVAVVAYNLGGPDGPDEVRPFLFNLFNDPKIVGVPTPVRWLLAQFISRKREATAKDIYARLGGGSPLRANTEAQAAALEATLAARGDHRYRCFVMMRYWHPLCADVVRDVSAWGPDRIVLLPLYPQFSTTTVGSMLRVWSTEKDALARPCPTTALCCYPDEPGFIAAVAEGIRAEIAALAPDTGYRILFSAHGLPKKIVAKGDPYQWQVERSAAAVMTKLGLPAEADWLCCYQSRVGPLEWIGPATDDEIRRAGADGKAVVLVPIAFVSEHAETLVELDIEYRHLADAAGVPDFRRVATVGTAPAYIDGLARLVARALESERPVCSHVAGRYCPGDRAQCPLADGGADDG